VRLVAGHDWEKAQRVLDWPLHEVLIAYVEQMREAALDSYQHSIIVWALTAPHSKKPAKPPRVPAILK
jgi:hypothetical protein